MRILFCNYEYPPLGGGGGVVMQWLAEQLAKRRHEVTVLTSQAFDLATESVENNVNVIRTPVFFRRRKQVANLPSMAAYLPMGIYRGLRLGSTQRFDVINTHFVVPSGPVGHALSRFLGAPNVLTAHGGDLFDPSKGSSPHRHAWLRTPIHWLLSSADTVVGQSRDTVEHIEDIYDVHRPIDLVPLGIKRPPRRISASRAMFGLPEDAFVIVTVGRMVPRKSTPDLVRVLKTCNKQARSLDIHLAIVGDGPQLQDVQQTAMEMGVADKVHCLGELSEAQKFAVLGVADVFASASQHEGFGLVFLEAMAAGLPVVCYDRGGQTDFLDDGATGHVVPLNDRDRMVRAILDLRHDKLRNRIGRNNQELVESYYIDRCAERYEEIFASAMHSQRQH